MSPWLSAPLFTAASPLGTEAVGWVSARADTASAAPPATTSATATGHRRHLEVSSCARMGRPPALSVVCGRGAEDNKGGADSEGSPRGARRSESGRCRSRTSDLLLVRQALYQLS